MRWESESEMLGIASGHEGRRGGQRGRAGEGRAANKKCAELYRAMYEHRTGAEMDGWLDGLMDG